MAATASTGFEKGDTVSYKQNFFGSWRDTKIVRVDTTMLLPLIIEDLETGDEYSVAVSNVV